MILNLTIPWEQFSKSKSTYHKHACYSNESKYRFNILSLLSCRYNWNVPEFVLEVTNSLSVCEVCQKKIPYKNFYISKI